MAIVPNRCSGFGMDWLWSGACWWRDYLCCCRLAARQAQRQVRYRQLVIGPQVSSDTLRSAIVEQQT